MAGVAVVSTADRVHSTLQVPGQGNPMKRSHSLFWLLIATLICSTYFVAAEGEGKDALVKLPK
jgi:hypothetical protein